MRALALIAIRLYQKYLSPHKGFCCAYRTHTGRRGCSGLGLKAIAIHGVLDGLGILQKRLYLCGVAHRRYDPPIRRAPLSQRGDCDIGCDAPADMHCIDCDLPNGRIFNCLGDVCSNSCSCDWPSKKPKTKESERYIYIPPKVSKPKDE